MIEVKNIKKVFGDKTIIEDVSSVMKAGQCNLIESGQVEVAKRY